MGIDIIDHPTLDINRSHPQQPTIPASFFLRDISTLMVIFKAATTKDGQGSSYGFGIEMQNSLLDQSVYRMCNYPGVIVRGFQEMWRLPTAPEIRTFMD
jgi:hypothetical protein